MSKSLAELARHPAGYAVILALAIAALMVAVMNAGATPASNFMEGGSSGGDSNVRDGGSPDPPYDWANTGTGAANTCPAATSGFTVVNLAGTGGLFNCGQGDGQFTTPIAPIPTANGTIGTNNIDAIAFKVDPLASDRDTCGVPQTLDGDPTVYTKTGGEKNGDSLVIDSTGGNAVETWSTGSVPPKDDVSNVYAVSRSGASLKELFFGAERVVNNGDTHLDFEFLQAGVSLSLGQPPATCSGKFDGHRTHGDFIASIDYTKGGSLGTFSLAQWHCNVDTHSADNSTGWVTDTVANPNSLNGTTCDFAAGTGSSAGSGVKFGTGPHYQEVLCVDANPNDTVSCPPISFAGGGAPPPVDAVNAVTNGSGPVPCGGWACRLADGTTPTGSIGTCTATSCIDTNELMEGSINLQSLGFTGCISTFIPHTRSSQSFTATTKDFELIPFNTCSAALNIKKVSDDTTTLLAGACFSISPAAGGVTSVCDGGAQDKDPTAGIICVDGVSSGSYTVTETTPPTGYIGDPDSQTKTIPSPLSTNVTCPGSTLTFTFSNTLGSLAWEKRSDIDGSLLDGATFTIGGSSGPFACTGDSTNPVTVVDNSAPDSDPDDGQFAVTGVCTGTYTLTETVAPPGYGIDPDATRSCTVSATASDCVIGTQSQADSCPDSNDASDTDEEDFCNVVGSLAWEKRSVKAGNSLVGGATFTVSDGNTTRTVTDCESAPCSGEDQDADPGQFCIDGVVLNTLLTVTETAPPDNYIHDPSDQNPKTATVTSSSTCSGGTTSSFTFFNVPLSEIEVIFRSLAGDGVTSSHIDCSPSGDTTEQGDPDPAFDDTDETFTNLEPGTYNCTVVIDP